MRVNLNSSGPDSGEQAGGFTLVLAKNRRIEGDWNFAEQNLARLIRIVEAA